MLSDLIAHWSLSNPPKVTEPRTKWPQNEIILNILGPKVIKH